MEDRPVACALRAAGCGLRDPRRQSAEEARVWVALGEMRSNAAAEQSRTHDIAHSLE